MGRPLEVALIPAAELERLREVERLATIMNQPGHTILEAAEASVDLRLHLGLIHQQEAMELKAFMRRK